MEDTVCNRSFMTFGIQTSIFSDVFVVLKTQTNKRNTGYDTYKYTLWMYVLDSRSHGGLEALLRYIKWPGRNFFENPIYII